MSRDASYPLSVMEYDKWAEQIKTTDSHFGKPGSRSPGAWSSRIRPNSIPEHFNGDAEGFQWHGRNEDLGTDDAGSPTFGARHDGKNSYPAARSQEIAGYRKEMMEMLRGLPEGDFELTLQDIVEKRKEYKEAEPVDEKTVEELAITNEKEAKQTKEHKKDVRVVRSNSLDTGLLVKMLSPLSVAVRRKSFNVIDRSAGKVVAKDLGGKKKAIERKKSKDEEWWKKNEFSEKGSSKASSVGSSSSNSSSSSADHHFGRNLSM